jgi:hypothetical protein
MTKWIKGRRDINAASDSVISEVRDVLIDPASVFEVRWGMKLDGDTLVRSGSLIVTYGPLGFVARVEANDPGFRAFAPEIVK